jgi:hypothetical protein
MKFRSGGRAQATRQRAWRRAWERGAPARSLYLGRGYGCGLWHDDRRNPGFALLVMPAVHTTVPASGCYGPAACSAGGDDGRRAPEPAQHTSFGAASDCRTIVSATRTSSIWFDTANFLPTGFAISGRTTSPPIFVRSHGNILSLSPMLAVFESDRGAGQQRGAF